MALMAFAAPILPGKTQQWRRFVEELNGPRRKEYEDARRRQGVRERAFLQSTPQGDVVIVTMEGDDPMESFRRFAATNDPFTRWFNQQVTEIHGLGLNQIASQPAPQMMVDSEPGAAQQRQAA